MALRSGHGNGAGQPRIEVMPADEAIAGVVADRVIPPVAERRSDGTFAPGARTLQSAGGRARAGKTRLADRLGLRALPAGSVFVTYKASAVTFRRAQCAALAASVGGGYCGPAPSSFVASAALQLAWSRYFSDLAAETANPEMAIAASKLANDSRQNLLAAHELCAREAIARRDTSQQNPHLGLMKALKGGARG